MKAKLIVTLVGAVLTLGLVQVNAADSDFDQLVRKWTLQRDSLVLDIVRSWLRGASAVNLKSEIANLIGLESRLAVQGDIPLYMTGFSDARDPDKVLADLVRAYLKRRGIEFQTNDFLVGKEFKVLREDRAVLQSTNQAPAHKFHFQLWGKSNKTNKTTSK